MSNAMDAIRDLHDVAAELRFIADGPDDPAIPEETQRALKSVLLARADRMDRALAALFEKDRRAEAESVSSEQSGSDHRER